MRGGWLDLFVELVAVAHRSRAYYRPKREGRLPTARKERKDSPVPVLLPKPPPLPKVVWLLDEPKPPKPPPPKDILGVNGDVARGRPQYFEINNCAVWSRC